MEFNNTLATAQDGFVPYIQYGPTVGWGQPTPWDEAAGMPYGSYDLTTFLKEPDKFRARLIQDATGVLIVQALVFAFITFLVVKNTKVRTRG